MDAELENQVAAILNSLGYLGFKFENDDSSIAVKALVRKSVKVEDLIFKTKLSLDGYFSTELYEFFEYVYLNQDENFTEVKFVYTLI